MDLMESLMISAAGLPGSYFMRKSLGSSPTLLTCTVSIPSSRSSWFLKLMVLRR